MGFPLFVIACVKTCAARWSAYAQNSQALFSALHVMLKMAAKAFVHTLRQLVKTVLSPLTE